MKMKLIILIFLAGNSFVSGGSLINFNSNISWANQYLVITSSDTNPAPNCSNEKILESKYFSNLKNGFYVCVGYKSNYLSNSVNYKEQQKLKKSYVKFSGFFTDTNSDFTGSNDLWFLKQHNSNSFLAGYWIPPEKAKKDTPLELEPIGEVRLKFSLGKQIVWDTSFTSAIIPEVKMYELDSSNFVYDFKNYYPGGKSEVLAVFSNSDSIVFYEELFSEGDANNFEISEFVINEREAYITKSISESGIGKLEKKVWNGKTFQ